MWSANDPQYSLEATSESNMNNVFQSAYSFDGTQQQQQQEAQSQPNMANAPGLHTERTSSPTSIPHDPSRVSPPTQDAEASSHANGGAENNSQVPRPKRIACVICRKRKLRCDGARPSCATCSRLGHKCAYEEARKKSGPKRGYVKQLEARLAQVETMLKSQDEPLPDRELPRHMMPPSLDKMTLDRLKGVSPTEPAAPDPPEMNFDVPDLDMPLDVPEFDMAGFGVAPQVPLTEPEAILKSGGISWEMISLGLEEPLPPPDMVEELDELFFSKAAPTMPIINRVKYYTSMNLPPANRPPVCLRYAMWTYASALSNKYKAANDIFYRRARKYLELDEMKGFGEQMISLHHCQAWSIVGAHEFRSMFFPRAWASVGRAARLAMMMGLNRIDATEAEIKRVLPVARHPMDKEERRRTFWLCFGHDRVASVGTGWPMSIDEADIRTNVPCSAQGWDTGNPETTVSFQELMKGQMHKNVSSFAFSLFIAAMYGRNVHAFHRPAPSDQDDTDLNSSFWKYQRQMDMVLTNVGMSLPQHLRVPNALNDPLALYCSFSLQASTICLHQTVIFKVEELGLPDSVAFDSKRRCIVAATEIANLMKMISHFDFSTLMPFTVFCLYISCRVFVQYLKTDRNNVMVQESMKFLISAMKAMQDTNNLASSFLIHLDVDIEASGLRQKGESQVFFNDIIITASESAKEILRIHKKKMEELQKFASEDDVCAGGVAVFPAPKDPVETGSPATVSASSDRPTPSSSSHKGSLHTSQSTPPSLEGYTAQGLSQDPAVCGLSATLPTRSSSSSQGFRTNQHTPKSQNETLPGTGGISMTAPAVPDQPRSYTDPSRWTKLDDALLASGSSGSMNMESFTQMVAQSPQDFQNLPQEVKDMDWDEIVKEMAWNRNWPSERTN